MPDDEIESILRVLPEVLLEVRRRSRLDVTDGGSEGVPDALEAGVGGGVPRLVGNGTRGEQGDPKSSLRNGFGPIAGEE